MSHRSADRDGLVWRATGDRLVWQEAFGWFTSLGLLGLIGTCVSISEGNLPAALLLGTGVVAFAGWIAWRARRSVVEVRLHPTDRPTQLTFQQANGRTFTYPLAQLTRVNITRQTIVPAYGEPYEQPRMTLKISGHTLHTPYSTGAVPAQLRAALAAHAQITESETTLIDPGPDFS